MDNINFSELGSMIAKLQSNPQLLQMLMALMGNTSKPEQKQESSPSDPLSMLMGMSKGASGSPQKPENPSGGGIFGSTEDNNNRITLLNAVRPYLGEARRERLDTVLKLLKLVNLGGLSSIIGKI